MSTTEDREEFLKETQIAVLSTVDRKGQPHAIPMWCIYDDGDFLMSTGPRSQKYKNIENNSNVVLVFDRREPPYYAVMVHGTARLEITSSQDPIRRIATAYLGKEGAERYFAQRGSGGGDSGLIRVTPRKYIEYHGMSGR